MEYCRSSGVRRVGYHSVVSDRGGRADEGVDRTLAAARARLDALSMSYEAICITDGRDARIMAALAALQREWPELVVLGQQPWSDDDAALAVALRRARGDLVLTLAGWPEVALEDLAKLPSALGDADIVSAVRVGLPTSGWLAWRRRRFIGLLVLLFGQSPSDPFCRTRLARREVLEDVAGFGVRQQFIPIIAGQRGYKLAEIELRTPPGPATTARYVFRPLGHLRAFFDALTLYVVLNFLRRPLRFFGSIGLPIFVVGALVTIVLVIQNFSGDSLGRPTGPDLLGAYGGSRRTDHRYRARRRDYRLLQFSPHEAVHGPRGHPAWPFNYSGPRGSAPRCS